MFMLTSAVASATAIPFPDNWDIRVYFSEHCMYQCLVVVALELALRLLAVCTKHPFLVPSFFIAVPVGFYFSLHAMGTTVQEARDMDWIFSFVEKNVATVTVNPSAQRSDSGFAELYALFDFSMVQWAMIPTQWKTMLGLVIFSVLHVPINIPAISMTTGIESDINHELKVCVCARVCAQGVCVWMCSYGLLILYFRNFWKLSAHLN
jgi:SulP family sulfate permease